MNNENFIFLKIMNEINKYIRRFLPSYPKKESVLKSSIEKNLYDMFECIFAYNIHSTTRMKEKSLKEFMIKLAMLDVYIKDSYHLKYISSKQMKSIVNKETELKKISYALLKGLKNE